MTSLGRGRGRAWAQYDKDSLRKPGESLCTKDTDYGNLIRIINDITAENLEQQAVKFTQFINNDNLVNIHNKLHEHAVNNGEFGPKLIMLYRHPMVRDVFQSDENLWKLLINKLQDQYERRIELKQEYTVTQFCNTISLLSNFLHYMRVHNTMLQLQSALLDYMEMLRDAASAEEIKTFTEQVVIHGKYMFQYHEQKFSDVMIIPRQILIRKNLSQESRVMLLYSIDLFSYNFKPLPQNLLKFYEQQLGRDFIEKDNVFKNEFENQEKLTKSLVKGSLRAIRGSGATDAAKE